MIDHIVKIGGIDVSRHVISINTSQTIEDDSNPGKMTVVLANVDAMYTDAFVPQLSTMSITLYNFVYGTEREFKVAWGRVTDTAANPDVGEITITGEDDLGHLADFLPHEFNIQRMTCSDVLKKVLATHDPQIKIRFSCSSNPEIGPVVYSETETYQTVLEDIRSKCGANFFFDEAGWLIYNDANKLGEPTDLDPFVMNPSQAKSIMGFVNEVELTCYRPVDDNSEQQTSPDHGPLIGHARDDSTEYSVANIKVIRAPLQYLYNVHNQEDADKAARQLLDWYNSKKDALTEVTIAGIAPRLQGLVKYTSFSPIDSDSPGVPIYGMVLERNIDYSAEGFITTIKIHPRLDSPEVRAALAGTTTTPGVTTIITPDPVVDNARGKAWLNDDGTYDIITNIGVTYDHTDAATVYTMLGVNP